VPSLRVGPGVSGPYRGRAALHRTISPVEYRGAPPGGGAGAQIANTALCTAYIIMWGGAADHLLPALPPTPYALSVELAPLSHPLKAGAPATRYTLRQGPRGLDPDCLRAAAAARPAELLAV